MKAKGILLLGLAAVCIAAVYQSQSPTPKRVKLGKRQCAWIPTTPADTAPNAKKSLKCRVTSTISMTLDSAGVGSGGGKLNVTQDSAGVGSGGAMKCTWAPAPGRRADPNLVCTMALQVTVDSAGIGAGGGGHN